MTPALDFAYDALARRTKAVGEAVLARLARQQRPVHETELPRLLGGLPKTWPHALALAAALGLAEVDHRGLVHVPVAPAVSVERTIEALDIERQADEARRLAQAAKQAARAAQTPDERRQHQLNRNRINAANCKAGLTGPKMAAAAARAAASPPPVTGDEPVTRPVTEVGRSPSGAGDARVSSVSSSASSSPSVFTKIPEEEAETEELPASDAREPEPAPSPAPAVTASVTEPTPDAVTALVTATLVAWTRRTGQPAELVSDTGLAAIRRRAASGQTAVQLEAAAARAAVAPWFVERPKALVPEVVYGERYEALRNEGLRELVAETPRPVSGSRHVVAPPADAPGLASPRPPAVEARPLPRQTPPALDPARRAELSEQAARAAQLLDGVGRVVPPVRRSGGGGT